MTAPSGGQGDAAEGQAEGEFVDEQPLRRFLRGARPSWTAADLAKVEAKLRKVDIDDLPTLLMSLKVHSDAAFNSMFREVDEKGFSLETLRALRQQEGQALPAARPVWQQQGQAPPPPAAQPMRRATEPRATQQRPERPPPEHPQREQQRPEHPKPVSEPLLEAVPEPLAALRPWAGARWAARPETSARQLFRVAHPGPEGTGLAVQQWPELEAPEIGRKLLDDVLEAEEETFDGWVRLANEPGWMLRHACWQHEIMALLAPLGEPLQLATPEVSSEPGPRRLEVVCLRMVVREAPSSAAKALGSRELGETVQAESQTYDGWVRLLNGAGWVLSFSPAEGPLLLLPVEEQAAWREQRSLGWQATSAVRAKLPHIAESMLASVRETLQRERRGKDPARIRSAVLCAKAVGYSGTELRAAELEAECLRRGWSGAEEAQGPADCRLAEGPAPGDPKGGGGAADWGQDAERLRIAVVAGDAAAVRAALKAAKAAGVPKREIARVYALQCASDVA